MSQKRIVPTVHDVAAFEAAVAAGRPVILDLPLDAAARERLVLDVQAAFRQQQELFVFMGDSCEHRTIAGADFHEAFRAGSNVFNVVQHTLGPAHVAPLFIPQVFASPARNLHRNLDEERQPVSLVASPLFTHTPPHVDSGAYGNWMVLVEGRKLWMLVAPEDEAATWDPRRKAWFCDGEEVTHLLHYGLAGPYQLIYAPPRWVHGVITLERALGYGGQFLGHADMGPCLAMTRLLLERGVENPAYLPLLEAIAREAGEAVITA